MIATADPVSPHEASSKDPLFATSPSSPTNSMVPTERATKQIPTEKHRSSDASTDSVAGEIKNEDDGDSASEESEFGEDKASDELELLSLEDLAGTEPSRAEAASSATDAAPVKRIVRRKRKRMSEDERRVRHREVQRQFMKRKRARLAEMRKHLRGLDSQLRLAQATSDRARLEKENDSMRELLANPGSGWKWDDDPQPSKSMQSNVDEQRHHQAPSYPGHQPSLFHVAPAHAVPSHMMIGFHHGHAPHQASIHGYPTHVAHIPHHQMYPVAVPARLSSEHRLQHSGVPLPWDDIFEAVSTDNPGGASQDFSF